MLVCIGLDVREFLDYYRNNFPLATITPKMHMLEDHAAQWMERWHFCPGFHGEQGGEGLHAIFNGLARTYSTIRNPAQQLLLMVREHQVQVSPLTDDLRPLPKRKK